MPEPPSTPPWKGHTTAQGRAAWLGKAHGFGINPKEVMVSAGAKQSCSTFHVLLDEGDEIIIQRSYCG